MVTPRLTYESHNSTAYAEGVISITKPTGLAEGDLLAVFLFFSTADTVSTPSGWTVVSNSSTSWGIFADAAVFYKIADSADVAASTFSFDVADGSGSIGGTLVRFSGVNTNNVFEQLETTSNTSELTTQSHTTSIIPTTANSIVIAYVGYNIATTMTGYTSTGSPTWTELTQLSGPSGTEIAVVYAPYPSTTEITNFSFTVGSAGGGARSDVIFFVLRTRVDVDVSQNLSEVSVSDFTPASSSSTNVTQSLDTVEVTDINSVVSAKNGTIWTNETKPTTTWTNEII